MTDADRRQDLARFLRSRREVLRPEDFGLTPGRRRTPGLRREEVAQVAGISATWYIWLEQGRDVRASPHALASLARALRLSQAEQTYLMKLARPDLDWRGRLVKALPSTELQSLLNGLAPHPAYVLNRYWQLVAINTPARRLLGEWAEGDAWAHNLLARLFLDPAWRTLFIDWPEVARSAVAQFRLATAAMREDKVLEALLTELGAANSEFNALWNARDLAEPPVWKKRLRHADGERHFYFATFRPEGRDRDFWVSIYTSADAAALSSSTSASPVSPD
ncbi:MAG TPA: helix-turn-helix transcriptional regulator [Asticcacaulis sp.]|nr:helix-turn-helix transcriptional regulator [Asticcacaulis sp.]